MNESPQIFKALALVMADVGAVRKAEFNSHQKFSFRGIDAVINAVSPAFRNHGVFCIPKVISSEYESVQVGQNRTVMGHARVMVRYTFHASDGSSVAATVTAESMDSGDKATAKAMSVAYRTALLQTLCLPTDEADPDADTFERSPVTAPPRREEAVRVPRATQTPERNYEPQPAQREHTRQAPKRSDAQATLMNNLLKQCEVDEQLIVDSFKVKIDDMNVPQAKTVIDALLRLKKGESEVQIGADGVPFIQ
jgi:hypothetical protein